MGEIVSIKDVSADGHTTVQVTYDLINKENIDIIYGMQPAISYRDLGSDKVYHKRYIESKCESDRNRTPRGKNLLFSGTNIFA